MKKYIGNVVAQSQLKLEKGLRKCATLSEVSQQTPTIIVGIDHARSLIPDFSILKKKYNNGQLWWTFSRTERLYDYKADMKDFYQHCVSSVDNNVEYVFVDVKSLTRRRTVAMIQYAMSDDFKYVYCENNSFLFVYSPLYKRIWGLSLSTAAYMGVEPRRITDRLKENKSNLFIESFSVVPSQLRQSAAGKTHKLIVLYDLFS